MPIIVDPTSSAAHVEAIVLDPSEVATGRTEFDISNIIKSDGVDWGDAAIEAYMAEATRGQVPVDFRVPNRIISIPLVIKDTAAVTFDVARQVLQAKVGLFHREGGWLKREINGTPLYADVVNATLKLGGSTLQALRSFDVDATLSLECLPDFYGDEITLDDMVETSAAELVKILKVGGATVAIKGDYPARCRIVVDDDQNPLTAGVEPQLAAIWALRSRYYSSANTAADAYEAEALTPSDVAAVGTVSGASGGASNNVVTHGTLSTEWSPVLSTDLAGVGQLTHRGTCRVFARVYTVSTPQPKLRLVWDVGDLTNPSENAAVAIPDHDDFYIVDLGEVRLDPAPIGTHRWRGIIQAKGESSGLSVSIDRIWFVPVDDGFGIIRGAAEFDTVTEYTARDEFSQTAGSLTGKTLASGQTWAIVTGTGGTDYTVTGSGTAQRTGTTTDRMVTAGSTVVAGVVARVDVIAPADASSVALVVRVVDINNHLTLQLADGTITLRGLIGGTLHPIVAVDAPVTAGEWYTLRLYVSAAGRYSFWCVPQGTAFGDPLWSGVDATLAFGAALEDGKVGIRNLPAATGTVCSFDNFAAWEPLVNAAINTGESAELRSDGMFRATTDGSGYGRVASVVGDLPRLPPSGLEARPVELFLKASRGDVDQLPDTAIDDISVRVYYRPCWLFVPES